MATAATLSMYVPQCSSNRRTSVPSLSLEDLLESFDVVNNAIKHDDDTQTMRRASSMLSEALQNDLTNTLETGVLSASHCELLSKITAEARSVNGSAHKAEQFYEQLKAASTDVLCQTPTVLNTLLNCHAKCYDGTAARAARILAEAVEAKFAVDAVTYNTAINVLAKCSDGSAARAYHVLHRMRQEGVRPNLVTFNSVIDAQGRRRDGSAQRALQVLSEMMQDRDIKPDLSTFTSVINLQARLDDGSAAAAFKVLDQMRNAGIPPNTIILNSVIDAQAKRSDGKSKVALLVLDAMRAATQQDVKPNVVTYTSAIDCCAKCDDGDGKMAVELLEELTTMGLAPNHVTYGTAINCQAKRGSARMASAILKKMLATKVHTTVVAFNSVLHANAKCDDGSATEALLVLESMKSTNITPNIITYTSAIDCQAKKSDGLAETAAQLLEEAVQRGLRPDTVTFTAVLDAQAKRKDGCPKRASAILDMMMTSEIGCKPNHIHFNSALNACANARPSDIRTAEHILASAASALKPNNYTLSALLRCCAFSEPPQPDLAAKLFREYGRQIQVNDHVERALRLAVPEHTATELFRAVGHTPRRRSSTNNYAYQGSTRGNATMRRPSASWRTYNTATIGGRPRSSHCDSYVSSSSSHEYHSGASSDEEPPSSYKDYQQRRRVSTSSRKHSAADHFQSWRAGANPPSVATDATTSGYSSGSTSSPASSPPNRRHSFAMAAGPRRGSTTSNNSTGGRSARKSSSFGDSLEEASRLIHEVASTTGTERRNSLAGIHATEMANSPSLSQQARAGLTNALTGTSQTPTTGPALPVERGTSLSLQSAKPARRRMSLAEKVRAIKANAGVGAGGEALAASSASDVECSTSDDVTSGSPLASPISHCRSTHCADTTELLSPEFFSGSGTPDALLPDRSFAEQRIVRKPSAPDGTRGFGDRRRSSMLSQVVCAQ
eukprot:m.412592 g.412592  ORF g.412592 m.412592 type:complete len:954 (-) comp21257_c0_seq2:178-3039(-)